MISCGARLAPFDIKELRDLTAYDELELDTLGEKKTALFVIISDTDATFNFIVKELLAKLAEYKPLAKIEEIECIWRILTAGFAEQNGRNAKLNGRITFDY